MGGMGVVFNESVVLCLCVRRLYVGQMCRFVYARVKVIMCHIVSCVF